MNINKNYELNFIRAIQKSANKRTSAEQEAISIRNGAVAEQFRFTPKVRKKLMLLNEKLQVEEKRIFTQYCRIEKNCTLMVVRGEIDDYNIDINLEYWNNNHYRDYAQEIDGSPFFLSSDHFMVFQDKSTEYNAAPHNDFCTGAPFPEINHCYSFHSLYDHCYELTWFDIYNIDEVWMEIKIDYQFRTKLHSESDKR